MMKHIKALSLLLLIPVYACAVIRTPSITQQAPTSPAPLSSPQQAAPSKKFEEWFNKGIEHFKNEQNDEAIAALEQARALIPTSHQVYFNMGLVYLAQDKPTQAITQFEQAIINKPDYLKAHVFLAQTCHKLNLQDAALIHYKRVIELDPTDYESIINTARIYRNQQKDVQAIELYKKAMNIQPTNIVAIFDMAFLHTLRENYDEAVALYKKVLTIAPDLTDTLMNLAHTLRYQGKMSEAVPYYKQLIARKNGDPHAHYGLAECSLALGNFPEGFKEFEWRWKRGEDIRNFSHKYWDGNASLSGKTILVRAEYGQGDTMQFIRYAKFLKEKGARVIVESQDTLLSLLGLCPYIDQVTPVTEKFDQFPAFDYQIPLMSLPYIFKTSLETTPAQIPYLYASPKLVDFWKDKIKDDHNFKIGICWECSPYYDQFKAAHSKKSIPLAAFGSIAQLPGISLYSLQKMDGIDQLKTLPNGVTINHFGENFDHANGRFMDTAALMQNLDLIICIDTSVAHLAGALGKPVWLLLPTVPDWRWMLNRNDSPWYPSMRIFRQYVHGDWQSVIATMAHELKPLIAKALPHRSPSTQAQTMQAQAPLAIMTEVQIGELVDKITILQIKAERIKDQAKLKNVKAELETLLISYKEHIPQSAELEKIVKQLKDVNEKLWVIEDDIRDKERKREFDEEFIRLARAVYYTNDDRCSLKRDINKLAGSRLVEEKSYSDYKVTQA